MIFVNRKDAEEYTRKSLTQNPNWTFKIAHVKVVDVEQNARSEIFWFHDRTLKTRTLVVTEGTEGYVTMFNSKGKDIKDTRFMEEQLGVQVLNLFCPN